MAHRTRSLILLVTVPLLLAVACTKDVNDPAAPTVTVGDSSETVTLDMASAASTLYKVGPDGERTYGQNVLRGTAVVDGRPATVEILGNVEYLAGSGPFYGFLTVTWKDGSLGFNMQGQATKAESGSTALAADLRFIGGSGDLEGAQAAATFRGSRAAEVGSPIKVTLGIEVVDSEKE